MTFLRSLTQMLLFIIVVTSVCCKGKSGEIPQSQSISGTGEPSATVKEIPDQDLEQEPTDTGGKAGADLAKELAMQEAALNGDATIVKNLIGEGIDVKRQECLSMDEFFVKVCRSHD